MMCSFSQLNATEFAHSHDVASGVQTTQIVACEIREIAHKRHRHGYNVPGFDPAA